MAARPHPLDRLLSEGGFSLVETVVAMTVAAGVFLAGGQVLGNALRTTVFARNHAQAAELLSEEIEQLRGRDYAAVAMVDSDLSSDPAITGLPTDPAFDPDGPGPLPTESIATAVGGSVNPHQRTVTRNRQEYRLSTYVTVPEDGAVAAAKYKRVTVVATWEAGARTLTRQASSLLSITRRGLPLPNFTFTTSPPTTRTVNAGTDLVLPTTLVNRGARDAFNLEAAMSSGIALDFDWYLDLTSSGTLGVHDPTDTALGDGDGDGRPETGLVEVDEAVHLLAVAAVPTTATPGTYTASLSAHSIGQPGSSTAWQTATYAVEVVNDAACSGCTYQTLHLRNEYPSCASPPCASTARVDMPAHAQAPVQATLPNFDTDVDVDAGRRLALAATTPAADATSTSTMANWRYQMPSHTTLTGDLVVDLWAATQGFDPALSATLRVYVRRNTTPNGSFSLVNEATAVLPATDDDWEAVQLRVPVNIEVQKNRWIEVKVVVDAPGSTGNVWLAYDTTAFPATVRIPVAG